MVKSKSIWSDQNHFVPTKTVLVTQKDKALEFKLEKIIGIQKHSGKVRKKKFQILGFQLLISKVFLDYQTNFFSQQVRTILEQNTISSACYQASGYGLLLKRTCSCHVIVYWNNILFCLHSTVSIKVTSLEQLGVVEFSKTKVLCKVFFIDNIQFLV